MSGEKMKEFFSRAWDYIYWGFFFIYWGIALVGLVIISPILYLMVRNTGARPVSGKAMGLYVKDYKKAVRDAQ